jgi:hypothetical protein
MVTYNRMPTAARQNLRVWLTMTIHIRIPIFVAAVCSAVVAIAVHPAWGDVR